MGEGITCAPCVLEQHVEPAGEGGHNLEANVEHDAHVYYAFLESISFHPRHGVVFVGSFKYSFAAGGFTWSVIWCHWLQLRLQLMAPPLVWNLCHVPGTKPPPVFIAHHL